jgi:hypothetical protein
VAVAVETGIAAVQAKAVLAATVQAPIVAASQKVIVVVVVAAAAANHHLAEVAVVPEQKHLAVAKQNADQEKMQGNKLNRFD